ncbi:MAG: triphosphoribosyl-dephospho-CoA synthase [Candidatus Helarchaeota archaeon]
MNLLYSINDILDCAQLAVLLEVSGYPKPGNVHRNRDFTDTRFEHFLVGGVVIRNSLQMLCENIINLLKVKMDYSQINMGKYILKAVEDTKRWQKGGNINLGVIILLTPLCTAACLLVNRNKKSINDFRIKLDQIIKNSIAEDTINLYKAIKIASPGGLGEKSEYDVHNESSIEKIKNENINLYDIFKISMDWDSISKELVSKYQITFEIGVPFFIQTFQECNDINITTVNTFLKIASEIPDSLIIRQHGERIANEYRKKALELISRGGLLNSSNKNKLLEWERSLIKTNLKINPGTTADLTVSTIFISLLTGIRF